MEHRNLEWPTYCAIMQETCHEIPVSARPQQTAWVIVSNGNPNRKDKASLSRVAFSGLYSWVGSRRSSGHPGADIFVTLAEPARAHIQWRSLSDNWVISISDHGNVSQSVFSILRGSFCSSLRAWWHMVIQDVNLLFQFRDRIRSMCSLALSMIECACCNKRRSDLHSD